MADKNFERMIKLGEWLQDYLKPDTPNWRLLEIFQAGAELIDVKEKISPDCGIALCLEDKLIPTEQKISSPSGREYLSLNTDVDSGKKDSKQVKTFTVQEIEGIKNKTRVFLDYGKNIEKVLREFHKYNLPWGKVLNEFEKDPFLYSFTGQLRESYSGLKEIIKKQDGNYLVTKSLSGVNYFEPVAKHIKKEAQKDSSDIPSTENFSFDDGSENPTFELTRNYRVIVARIIFEFFILGGQDYYLFCEQCGRFTVVRRKGRKKFCSDVCRTAFRYAQLEKDNKKK